MKLYTGTLKKVAIATTSTCVAHDMGCCKHSKWPLNTPSGQSTGVNNTGECLPVFPVLAQVSVNKCKKRCKFQSKQRYDGPAQKRFKKKAEILQEAHEDTKGVVLENPSEELPLQEADEDVWTQYTKQINMPFHASFWLLKHQSV